MSNLVLQVQYNNVLNTIHIVFVFSLFYGSFQNSSTYTYYQIFLTYIYDNSIGDRIPQR